MNNILHQLKFAIISLIVLTGTSAFACDNLADANAPRNPHHGARYSGIINAGFEDFLIRSGQQLLRQVYSEQPVDHRNSKLFAQTMGYLDPVMEKAKYSQAAGWALIQNTIRRYNTCTDEEYVAKRTNHLAAILSVCWALTRQADQQQEFFKRGSLTVIDPEHRLYQFLLGYVQLVTGNANLTDKTDSNFAYPRDPKKGESSHHIDRSPESQFGIDMRLRPDATVLKILPNDYTHILFGKLDLGQDKPLTFVKFEPVGLGGPGERAHHMVNYENSLKGVDDDARREKDLRHELSFSFGLFLEMARKANIQVSDKLPTIKQFMEMAMKPTVSVTDRFPTIREMYLTARDYAQKGEVPGAFEAREFLRRLDVNYPAGNHDLRTGNEVIIDMPEFLKPKH